MLQSATNNPHPTCINSPTHICGDFTTGTARKLIISTTADHITEPYDPQLIDQVINWTQKALKLPINHQPVISHWLIIGLLIAFTGGIATSVWIFWRTGKPVELPKLRPIFRYFVTWLIGFLILILSGLALTGLGPTRGASNMLIFSYVLQLCSNYALRYPEKGTKALRVASLYSILILVAFILPALICGSTEIWINPSYLIDLPKFLLQWPFFTIYNYSQVVKLVLIPAYTLELQISWLFILLVGLELILPGSTLSRIEQLLVWAIRWLRHPIRFSGIGRISRKDALLLAVLALILVIILSQRLADGLLVVAASKGMLALQMLGLFLLLPIIVIICGLRSRSFQRLESWLILKRHQL